MDTNEKEIEQYIGILMMMGILKYPQYRMYWSPYTKCSAITEVMGLKRFEIIKRYFHINDNTNMPKKGTPDFDRLYKVRPLVNSVVEKCRQAQQEECQSIDEQMILTKSRSPIRQYLPMKPHKWGLKVWARCGVSDMLYDFNVYLGKEEDSAESREYGKVGAVVLKLVEYLPKKKGHKLYIHGQPLFQHKFVYCIEGSRYLGSWNY